jgi:predicted transcriptional regulator YheO
MYDREFTSQEYSDMIFKVKDKMKSEMQDESNLKVAKERAEEIIKTKVKEKGVFNVKVIWR